jgi:hypothetical protein
VPFLALGHDHQLVVREAASCFVAFEHLLDLHLSSTSVKVQDLLQECTVKYLTSV